jgi:hypothetical protein
MRAPSGVEVSQVPTANTVILALLLASSAKTWRVMASGPSPWKVSATSGRPLDARTTSTAGPPGTPVVVVVTGGVVVVERVIVLGEGAAVGGPAHPARAVVAAIPNAARREIRRVTP